MNTYQYEREVDVKYDVDVLVVGGGPGGIGAAVAAARLNANVLLIERENCLGGLMTGGLVHSFQCNDERVVKGIYLELCEEMRHRNAFYSDSFVCRHYDPEQMKLVLDKICRDAGVRVLLHTTFVDAIMDGRKITGAVISSIEGIQAVHAKVVIDATMVASVARSAGAEVTEIKQELRENYATQFVVRNVNKAALMDLIKEDPDYFSDMHDVTVLPDTRNGIKFHADVFMGGQRDLKKAIDDGDYMFDAWPTIINASFCPDGKMLFLNWLSNRDAHFENENGTYVTGYCDAIHKYNTVIISNAERMLREQADCIVAYLRGHVKGFENAVLDQTPNNIGLLVSHIVGTHVCTVREMLEGAVYDDSVFVSTGFIDALYGRRYDTFPHDVPFGAIISANTENLLAAGLHISTEGLGERAISTQVGCLASGQAAGTAAAVAVRSGKNVREINISVLQEALRKAGAVVSSAELEPGTMEEYKRQAEELRAVNGESSGDKWRFV